MVRKLNSDFLFIDKRMGFSKKKEKKKWKFRFIFSKREYQSKNVREVEIGRN